MKAQNALLVDGALSESTTTAELDDAALILQGLRKRGSGINLRNRPPTTARCARILKLLGLTPTLHGLWCGVPVKEWIKLNPSWTEQQWARLVAENIDAIRAESTPQARGS